MAAASASQDTPREGGSQPGRNRTCRKCNMVSDNIRNEGRRNCDVCGGHFHLKCILMTRAQSRGLPRWACPTCLRPAGANTAPTAGDDFVAELPNHLARWKARIRVLARVPKGARISVAAALATLLKRVVQRKDAMAWARLLGFSFGALQQPSRTNIRDPSQPSLATKIKNQVAWYMAGEDRLPEPPELQADRVRNQCEDEDGKHLKRRVAAKFADGDVKGAVRLLASGEGFAGHGEEVVTALKAKHPPAPEDLDLPPPPNEQLAPPVTISVEEMVSAVTSFPAGSAAGPDGIRPAHLKDLMSRESGEAGEELRNALTEFINVVLKGEVPDFATSLFYGASLCALSKKDGGVRPIAVGNTFRRLATKAGLKSVSKRLGQHLRPIQLGFGTPGGCEAAVHATRQYINAADEKRIIVKVDMRNAFNTIRRDVFLKASREHTPSLFRSLWQAYAKESTLFFGESLIPSATGIQQGDPIGPALFSLGVDSTMRRVQTELNVWYLDDATLGGSVESVLTSLSTILVELRQKGLIVNDSKCEVIILNHTAAEKRNTLSRVKEVIPGVRVLQEAQHTLLGSPLSRAAEVPALHEKKEQLQRLVSRLSYIDAHPALVLLKNCFAIPKLQYIMRTSPVYRNPEALQEIDEVIRSAVTNITNTQFAERNWTQATLPVRCGGLGIRRTTDIAPPAYISSLFATADLVTAILSLHPGEAIANDLPEATEAIRAWKEQTGAEEEPQDTGKAKQKAWDTISSDLIAANLLRDAESQVSRARLLAAARPESGVWLHAIPIPSVGTHLDAETLRIAVALRVGAPICHPHACRCGRQTDVLGHHALSCKHSAGRLPRHAEINSIIKRELHRAGHPSILEPVGLNRGDGKRPDGMTLAPYKNGRNLIWDATCVDTFAQTNVTACALEVGRAAQDAEVTKCGKYAALAVTYQFEPLAFETTGVFGPKTLNTIKEIGRRLVSEMGEPRRSLWLKQRLAIAILRGNATSIIFSLRQAHLIV